MDYARRQIKCPECRAEHRIPFQGVSSLPSNVTLIRFLDLHARITGEEPEPVPTFMEKCSVCGEKVEGVQRCAHCEKKVCPECKEAHVDLLRREINRINGQSRRCFGKMQEFRDSLGRCEDRLRGNFVQVKKEIDDSCKRLIEDLQAKKKKLLDEVETFNEQELKTLNKLKVAVVDELEVLESNSKLADDKLIAPKYPWTDQELSEVKEIYAKAMEFVRLFDPEVGDFTRKMRFNLVPEFDTMRKRICELGELKFTESASSLMASSLQYCSATGSVAVELCHAAASQAAAAAASGSMNPGGLNSSGLGGYGLAHSNSNANLGAGLAGLGGSSASTMLELPSMQNALMRSQSDHRLASQFQQRLKQQQQMQEAAAAVGAKGAYADRYGTGSSGARGRGGTSGAGGAGMDYETESLRSRYAPRGSTGGKDYDLLRDWPRPGDNDPGDISSFGSSIQFKSAFMRRKEKERQQYGAGGSSYGYNQNNDDDDDLTSEASYGGMSATGRNVRFYDSAADSSADGRQLGGVNLTRQQGIALVKLFDCKDSDRGPLSGVPKLETSIHLHERIHQMAAKAVVDKRLAEEEGKRDKDLVESARQAMNRVKSSAAAQRQAIVQQEGGSNKDLDPAAGHDGDSSDITTSNTTNANDDGDSLNSSSATMRRRAPTSRSLRNAATGSTGTDDYRADSPSQRHSPTPSGDLNSSTSTVVEVPLADRYSGSGSQSMATSGSQQTAAVTPPSPATSHPGGRRGLYGAAVTERSRRQLSGAIQDAVNYTTRRRSLVSGANSDSLDQPATPTAEPTSTSSSTGSTSGRPKRALRSTGRSMSKGASADRQQSIEGSASGTGSPTITARRRRTLVRGESSQQSGDNLSSSQQSPETHSKNYSAGSGGHSESGWQQQVSTPTSITTTAAAAAGASESAARSSYLYSRASTTNTSSTVDQTSTTTEDDDDDDDEDDQNDNNREVTRKNIDADKSLDNNDNITTSRRPFSAAGSDKRSRVSNEDDINGGDDDDDNNNGNDSNNESSDNKDNCDDDDDEDDTSARPSSSRSSQRREDSRNTGNRRSRELMPNAVNKLLDRSAQIRRDSQEQRSRGDSPQRSGAKSSTSGSQSSYYSGSSSTSRSGAPATGSGSTSGISSSVRSRLAYQRSHSINDNDDITNSSNSIYTTASSGSSSHRRPSTDDDFTGGSSRGRISSSGNSSDRTLTNYEPSSSRSLYRRDSSGTSESPSTVGASTSASTTGGYQSRFLARSRTSAALSGSSLGGHRSQASVDDPAATATSSGSRVSDSIDSTSSPRSYLSSRDRFMQSTVGIGSTSSASAGSSSSGRASVVGSTGGSATGGPPSAGKFTNLLAWRSMLRNRFNFPHQ